jgi:hypothetical protein
LPTEWSTFWWFKNRTAPPKKKEEEEEEERKKERKGLPDFESFAMGPPLFPRYRVNLISG